MTQTPDPTTPAEPAATEEAAPEGPVDSTASTDETSTDEAPTDESSAEGEAAPAEAAVPPQDPIAAAVAPGYAFEGAALELGGLMVGPDALTDVHIKIPLGMVNRHGLVAGATGTGKTKTLQLLAEQLCANGVPVFAADIKGDLSGLSAPGEESEKISQRAASVGQQWQATGFPVEYYALGGQGTGIPLRVTMSAFGPMLLSKVLDLNDTQESSLGLIFHYADKAGLPLLDLQDLRAVVAYLTSDEGKADLKSLGGLSSATAGVILRQLIAFSDQGADAFFGEPEFETSDFLQTTPEGKGLISLVELPNLQDRPALFSTFLMWLLADLFHELPEVGDVDQPKLVFFFDEAHLLFRDASKAFLDQIAQTVRLIRSKGVGVFFVTQSPTDVPDDVLAQLGSRVQHALRAHTPNDAKALKATVNTYPNSAYDDLGKVITGLGIGEAVITVMDERGAPTPVAWTRLRAPESLMGPADAAAMEATVKASPRYAAYATPVDRDSAREKLAARLEEGARKAEEDAKLKEQLRQEKLEKAEERKTQTKSTTSSRKKDDGGIVSDVVNSGAFKDFMRTAAREIARGMFGSGRR